jgi:hypothetical protein
MQDHTCAAPDCGRSARSSRAIYCEVHYYRLRRSGTLSAKPWHRRGTCAVDGCNKPEKNDSLCAMHWSRVQRTGSPAGVRPRRGGICSLDGCIAEHESHGLCAKHARRLRDNGDPLTVRRGGPGTGDAHRWWRGDEVTYDGVHARVVALRGSASAHSCVDCGRPARDWSYDHGDPDERQSDDGPYSLDSARYAARCRYCHIDLDRAPCHDAATARAQPGGWNRRLSR